MVDLWYWEAFKVNPTLPRPHRVWRIGSASRDPLGSHFFRASSWFAFWSHPT